MIKKQTSYFFTLHIAEKSKMCFLCRCHVGCSDRKSKYCVVQYAMQLLFEWLPLVAALLVMSVLSSEGELTLNNIKV